MRFLLLAAAVCANGAADTLSDVPKQGMLSLFRKYGISDDKVQAIMSGSGDKVEEAIVSVFGDVADKIGKERKAILDQHRVTDRAVEAEFQEELDRADRKVKAVMAKLHASTGAIDANVTANIGVMDTQAAEASLWRTKGKWTMGVKFNATSQARIQNLYIERVKHSENVLRLKLDVLKREVEVVNFVKFLVDGVAGKAEQILPPSLDRGLYCDTSPYANNTFESDPSARNGAKLRLGNPAGACINWNKVGGATSSCCMVPRGTKTASHAPWCWVSETEYAYCWREDLGPYGSGWKTPELKPLEQHFTGAFTNSSVNDCGRDCVEADEKATTKEQCMEACFNDEHCVGVTLLKDSKGCLKVSGYGTCSTNSDGIRYKTGSSVDFTCTQDDRVVHDLGRVSWLKVAARPVEVEA